MEIVLIALGLLLQVVGLIGCLVPVLPGPPLSALGLVALWGARGWHAETFDGTGVAVLVVASILATIFDNVAPVLGVKRYGGGRPGVWGSLAGMLIGMLFFPPLGMLIGAFVGAFAGEWIAGTPTATSGKAAWGVFMGTIFATAVKLAVSGVATFLFLRELL